MKRILFSLMAVVLCLGLVGGAFAYFSDVETSSGNTFTAGTLDLTYDIPDGNDGWIVYNGEDVAVINIGPDPGMKPCDKGEVTLSFHNEGSIAGLLTVTLDNIVDLDNGQNEPELAAGDDALDVGELSQQLGIVIWIDDGNNILDVEEVALYDGKLDVLKAAPYIVEMGLLEPCVDKFLAIAWHLQDHGADNNLVQSDSVSFDLIFDLVQS